MQANPLDEYQQFCEKLVQARKDAGLTQVEVAKALGKPQSYVSKCERGDRRLDAVELAKLAKLYQKKIDYFVQHID